MLAKKVIYYKMEYVNNVMLIVENVNLIKINAQNVKTTKLTDLMIALNYVKLMSILVLNY